MQKSDLRDKNGKLLGWIVTNSDNSQELRDQNGNILGFYDARTNTTKDKNQQLVGKGNILTTLLR